jgi:hypothetical protein
MFPNDDNDDDQAHGGPEIEIENDGNDESNEQDGRDDDPDSRGEENSNEGQGQDEPKEENEADKVPVPPKKKVKVSHFERDYSVSSMN